MPHPTQDTSSAPFSRSALNYSLLDALTHRRSRRFAAGMTLNGGPLAYASTLPPNPLSSGEEATSVSP